jgi:PleD family two-component response regulator
VSVGVAQYRTGEAIDALTKRADKALYEAKANGKNQTRFLP